MGYELDKLLKQYGVSSAFTPTYTGTAKPAAGETGPSQYTADKALFDKYKASYQERMGNTPMYADAQYQTQPAAAKPTSVEDLYKTYLGRTGETAGVENWKNRFGITGSSTSERDQKVRGYEPSESYDEYMARISADAEKQRLLKLKYPDAFPYNITPDLSKGLDMGPKPPVIGGIADNNVGGRAFEPTLVNGFDPSRTKSTVENWKTVTGGIADIPTGQQIGVTDAPGYRGKGTLDYFDVYNPISVDKTKEFVNAAKPELASRNFGNQALMDMTGSYYGGQLQAPTYANYATPKPTVASPLTLAATPVATPGMTYTPATTPATTPITTAPATTPMTGGLGYYAGLNPTDLSKPWYMQTANYDHPDAVKARAAAGYARGGQVKTHYYRGDRVELPDNYDMDGMELAAIDASDNPYGSDQASINRAAEATNARIKSYLANPSEIAEAPQLNVQPEIAPPAPVVTAPAAVAPAKPPVKLSELNLPEGLEEMLSKYTGGESVYGKELSDARTKAETENTSFYKMLEKALGDTKEEAPSKAEMYFRLAAAFGKPTKTGHFAESLGNVGEVLGEQAKEGRAQRKAERALKLQLGLKGQEARMAAAKEDVTALRGLASEEMKDKRAIATELLKQHIASGLPRSSAGNQALDEGFIPKTDKFKARVAEISQLNIEKAQTAINAAVNGMSVAQANMTLQNKKFEEEQKKESKLTAPELKLKVETEDVVAQTDQALKDLKRAYELNPNTFDSSLADLAQRKLLESAGSKDAKLIATREQENLLQKAALSQLKSTFPGAISNDERAALQDVQGIGAKSKEERAVIMKNAYNAIKSVNARHRKRLNEIKEGLYRDTTPPTGELE